MAKIIYDMRTSLEEDRPQIDFELPQTNALDLLRLDAVIRGERPQEDFETLDFVCCQPEATEWDYYSGMATWGMISQRGRRVLEPYMSRCFMFYPATLNGAPYYVIAPMAPIDCWDHDRAVVRRMPEPPHYVYWIDKYRFHKGRIDDPLIFTTPEAITDMFATESIPTIVAEHGLKGLRFDVVDDE